MAPPDGSSAVSTLFSLRPVNGECTAGRHLGGAAGLLSSRKYFVFAQTWQRGEHGRTTFGWFRRTILVALLVSIGGIDTLIKHIPHLVPGFYHMIESLIKQTKQFVPEACDGNYNRTPHPSPRYNVDASWVHNIVAGGGVACVYCFHRRLLFFGALIIVVPRRVLFLTINHRRRARGRSCAAAKLRGSMRLGPRLLRSERS